MSCLLYRLCILLGAVLHLDIGYHAFHSVLHIRSLSCLLLWTIRHHCFAYSCPLCNIVTLYSIRLHCSCQYYSACSCVSFAIDAIYSRVYCLPLQSCILLLHNLSALPSVLLHTTWHTDLAEYCVIFAISYTLLMMEFYEAGNGTAASIDHLQWWWSIEVGFLLLQALVMVYWSQVLSIASTDGESIEAASLLL